MKAIITKYHGPTNTRGARISASDGDGNRVTVPYDYAASDPHDLAVRALCTKMGWGGRMAKGTHNGAGVYVWIHDYTGQADIITETLNLDA